jgi:D-methionine transport system substrate-binding protein
MNRRTLLSAAAAAILAAGSFSASAAPLKELKIAATPVPQGEVLKFVKPILAKEGIDLKIIEFTDYIAPNAALDAKEVDVNFYQHQPFLDNAVRQRHINAVRVAPIYILPMAVYSQKLMSLKNVPNGARVSIPNDPSNGGRALLLLQSAGLIKLRSGVGYEATPIDVVSNPKKLKFVELEAAQVPRSLKDVDIAVVNSNYALGIGLNPLKDSIYLEDKRSPYALVVATRKGDQNDPRVQKLVKALQSPATKKFILTKYKGAVVLKRRSSLTGRNPHPGKILCRVFGILKS